MCQTITALSGACNMRVGTEAARDTLPVPAELNVNATRLWHF